MNYRPLSTPDEIRQVLELQAANHAGSLPPEVAAQDGFVTVRHDVDLLERMNAAYPSIIAKDGDRVAGYCLVMPREFAADIPILKPMFDMLATLSWNGRPISELRWFIMGQVCVDAAYRGQGVFDGMYAALREHCRPHFDFTITEVAERNMRSLRAHQRVGFQTLHIYDDPSTGERWHLIILETASTCSPS